MVCVWLDCVNDDNRFRRRKSYFFICTHNGTINWLYDDVEWNSNQLIVETKIMFDWLWSRTICSESVLEWMVCLALEPVKHSLLHNYSNNISGTSTILYWNGSVMMWYCSWSWGITTCNVLHQYINSLL